MVIALVLSGGTGSRLGADIPKQYLRVQGHPVLLYCMETLHKSPTIDAIQIVAAQEWQEEILRINGSTEPAVLAGMQIAMGPGDERNFKITTQADLEAYGSLEELEEKCAYYLTHEEERQRIAANGCRKATEAHTYRIRMAEMLRKILE